MGKKNQKIILNDAQKKLVVDMYASSKSKKEVQRELSELFECSERTIRNIANSLNLNTINESISLDNVLIYDIETSRMKADVWWTGKQFISHSQLRNEAKIISISWKWLGKDKVHYLTWDSNHCDKELMTKFLKEYNKATMVIGQNNNSFDNKWINTRAAKHRLNVNRFIKSFDIYRQAKKYFRLPSYSMKYMAQFFNITHKLDHEGIIMWEMVENGTKKQQKEYLKKMIDYNVGDIITTEELYLVIKNYVDNISNEAVRRGKAKYCCSSCSSSDVALDRTLVTSMGTIQRVFKCLECSYQYKISNKTYMDFLQRGIYGN